MTRRRIQARRAEAWTALASVTLFAVGVAGCTNVALPSPPPAVRGITVPLPPPSFAEATEVSVTIDGDSSVDAASGGFVLLYESVADDGRFEYPDGAGAFVFEDVVVNLPGNCLQLSEYDGTTDIFGQISSMKVLLAADEACAGSLCSAQDSLGACVCLEMWGVGC